MTYAAPKIFLKKYLCFILCPIFIAFTTSSQGNQTPTQFSAFEETEHLYLIGTYIRTWKILYVVPLLKLYEVKLYSEEPASILKDFQAQEQNDDKKKKIDKLAQFIVDPSSQKYVMLKFTPLQDRKSYSREKKAMMADLARAGFPVNDQWKLKENTQYQADVTNYVKHILGLSEDEPGIFYKYRKKDDVYKLILTKNNSAKIQYIPSKENTQAKPGSFTFHSSKVLEGMILTFISEEYCSDELKESLPQSLMKKLLE